MKKTVEYAPGMRIIVRGEEWMVKRVETNSLGNQTLQVVGISNLVKDYESRFMTDAFTQTSKEWTSASFLKSDYERRQALLELDVIVAKALGVSLDQLKLMYYVQFSTLRSHEAGTWYDRKGRIVFTNNRSLSNVGYARKEWEEIAEANTGVFTRSYSDDTMPGGPVERTIEYVAPFDRCDREKDYEEVWTNFENRFTTEVASHEGFNSDN